MGKAESAYDLARQLESFAERSGFVAPPAFYICGEFKLTNNQGHRLYSDEAHLWCESCGTALLALALPLIAEAEREDHQLCRTDADGEDTCPHCMNCGETLRGSISSCAVSEEIAHYREHPISGNDKVNARQAIEIAMVLSAAPDDPEAIAIGRSALDAIATAGAI